MGISEYKQQLKKNPMNFGELFRSIMSIMYLTHDLLLNSLQAYTMVIVTLKTKHGPTNSV